MAEPIAPALRASIVIPTRNRRATLARVLGALARQTEPHGAFEVIVVDDGSEDGTGEALLARRDPFALRVVRREPGGPSAARNAGIEAARAPIVIFLDDDVEPAPEFVRAHLAAHAGGDGLAVIGPTTSRSRYRQPWVVWQQNTMERQHAAMAAGTLEPSFRQFWSGNASVARAQLVAAGGFDPARRRAEDIDLGERLRRLGLEFRFASEAGGVHHAEQSFAAWIAVQRGYGGLHVEVFRRGGAEALRALLQDEWRRRRAPTRRLVRFAAGRPWRGALAGAALRLAVALARMAPMSRFSRAACGALANLEYWSGVADAVGGAPELFALVEQAPEREAHR